MKNVIKMYNMSWRRNSGITNLHTCSIGGVDLVTTPILLTSGQLLKIVGDVINSAGIFIPIGVTP